LQVCTVPFRWKGQQPEVCLITSLKNGRWIFPKGIIDPGESNRESALKEALEEAGLHGEIVGEPLGNYEDFKWGRKLRVTVLLMEVTQCDDNWLEDDVRERCWLSPENASAMLSKRVLRSFVKKALSRIVPD
jgi:8-oxo-dGTP pyrophosphatase MutT (NUDIX family)